jgi:methyl-accepting chemotaxis protein
VQEVNNVIINKFKAKIKINSLGTKLIIYFSAVLLVVCGGLGIFAYNSASQAVMNEVEKALLSLAEEGAKVIESNLEGQYNALEVLADNSIICDPNVKWEEKLLVLREEVERSGHIMMGIADINGTLVNTENEVIDISDRDYFQKAVKGANAISDPVISRADKSMVFISATPIDNDNQINGVLVAVRDLGALCNIVEKMGFGKKGYSFMINESGDIIAHKDLDLVLNKVNFIELSKTDSEHLELAETLTKMKAGEYGVDTYYYDGANRSMGYAPIKGTGWSVAVGSFQDEVLAGVSNIKNILSAATVIVLLLGFLITLFISRSITGPINKCTEFAVNMSTGDFSANVPENTLKLKDEIGDLARGFDTMQKSVQIMLVKVAESMNKVNVASKTLAASSQEMNLTLEEVAASSNEFSDNALRLNVNSQEMEKSSNEILQKAAGGNEAIKNTLKQMNVISEIVGGLKDVIVKLDERAEDIGKIVITIKSIAKQTNLLSLNAAIEAARAGEQGRGFAVVAEEVRKLAEKSAESASEITDLVEATQDQIKNAVTNMDKSVIEVQGGTEVVLSTGEVLKAIISSIEGIARQTEQVAGASQEIGAGSQEISASVEEQTATMGEISRAAVELQDLVNGLREAIGQFKY